MSLETCTITGEHFRISEYERDFCRKNDLSLPRLAPRRRIGELSVFIALPKFYRGRCFLSKQGLISTYREESGLRVYDPEMYQAEEWKPLDYGRPYNFNRPFFDQLSELSVEVPRPARNVVAGTNEGVDYCNRVAWSKNCYLCVGVIKSQDCMVARFLRNCVEVVDCTWCVDCELCYESVDLCRCYNVLYSEHCQDCSESRFLYDCRSCKDCFGCVGLDRAQYCFENEQLSAAEYRSKLDQIDLGDRNVRDAHQAEFRARVGLHPLRPQIYKSEDVTGMFITGSKSCKSSAFISGCEDLEHCLMTERLKDSLFCVAFGPDSELLYNCASSGNQAYNLRYSAMCNSGVRNLSYCYYVTAGSSDCFGCINLRRKNYCILNKEYSKKEYFELMPRIRAHMSSTGELGMMMPSFVSGYAYNGSDAQSFLPLTEAQARNSGLRWDEAAEDVIEGETMAPPNHIRAVADSIVTDRLRCEASGKQFAIQRGELAYYRKLNIPIPINGPLDRLTERGKVLNIESMFS